MIISRYRNIRGQLIKVREKYLPWFIAAMTALSANWAASSIQDCFKAWQAGQSVIAFDRSIYMMSFIFFCILFVKNKNRFFAHRTRYLTDDGTPEQRSCLFLFLSVQNSSKDAIPEGLDLGFVNLHSDLQKCWKLKNSSSGKKWNWEMPLRAISHHINTLEKVILVCSEKSIEQAHEFLNICMRYESLKRKVDFHILGYKSGHPFLYNPKTALRPDPITADTFRSEGLKGVSFDSFDMLTRSLLHTLHKLCLPEESIMIDITGGKKPASVVGAAVTFNTKIKAQYVDTEGENKVRSYDILYLAADTGGLGI